METDTIALGPFSGNGSPTFAATGETTAAFSITTDGNGVPGTINGDMYIYILASATQPSEPNKANMISGSGADYADSQVVGTAVRYNFSISGLQPGTTYWAFAYQLNENTADDGTDDADSPVYGFAGSVTTDGTSVSAPILTDPPPAPANVQDDTADVSVVTDTADGTIYVYVTSSIVTDGATIKANATASSASPGVGTETFNLTGLTAETVYFANFVHENEAGFSNTVRSAFITDASGGTSGEVGFVEPLETALMTVGERGLIVPTDHMLQTNLLTGRPPTPSALTDTGFHLQMLFEVDDNFDNLGSQYKLLPLFQVGGRRQYTQTSAHHGSYAGYLLRKSATEAQLVLLALFSNTSNNTQVSMVKTGEFADTPLTVTIGDGRLVGIDVSFDATNGWSYRYAQIARGAYVDKNSLNWTPIFDPSDLNGDYVGNTALPWTNRTSSNMTQGSALFGEFRFVPIEAMLDASVGPGATGVNDSESFLITDESALPLSGLSYSHTLRILSGSVGDFSDIDEAGYIKIASGTGFPSNRWFKFDSFSSSSVTLSANQTDLPVSSNSDIVVTKWAPSAITDSDVGGFDHLGNDTDGTATPGIVYYHAWRYAPRSTTLASSPWLTECQYNKQYGQPDDLYHKATGGTGLNIDYGGISEIAGSPRAQYRYRLKTTSRSCIESEIGHEYWSSNDTTFYGDGRDMGLNRPYRAGSTAFTDLMQEARDRVVRMVCFDDSQGTGPGGAGVMPLARFYSELARRGILGGTGMQTYGKYTRPGVTGSVTQSGYFFAEDEVSVSGGLYSLGVTTDAEPIFNKLPIQSYDSTQDASANLLSTFIPYVEDASAEATAQSTTEALAKPYIVTWHPNGDLLTNFESTPFSQAEQDRVVTASSFFGDGDYNLRIVFIGRTGEPQGNTDSQAYVRLRQSATALGDTAWASGDEILNTIVSTLPTTNDTIGSVDIPFTVSGLSSAPYVHIGLLAANSGSVIIPIAFEITKTNGRGLSLSFQASGGSKISDHIDNRNLISAANNDLGDWLDTCGMDAAWIQLGTNDVRNGLSPIEFRDDVLAFIEDLRSVNVNLPIALGLEAPTDFQEHTNASANSRLLFQRLTTVFHDVHQYVAETTPFVQMFNLWRTIEGFGYKPRRHNGGSNVPLNSNTGQGDGEANEDPQDYGTTYYDTGETVTPLGNAISSNISDFLVGSNATPYDSLHYNTPTGAIVFVDAVLGSAAFGLPAFGNGAGRRHPIAPFREMTYPRNRSLPV